jgi:hypothetical protein
VVKTPKGSKVKFVVWHGKRKHNACLRTVKSLIENMIIGVTRGFLYKMRAVYAHFPINVRAFGCCQRTATMSCTGHHCGRQQGRRDPQLPGREGL